jgi:uncharacterized protein YcnI
MRYGLVVGTLTGALLVPGTALAHIGTTPQEVPAGQSSSIAFRVGHGCDGSPTVSVSMQIPAGVTSVAPKAKSGWTIAMEEGTLPEPVDVDGETVTEGVVQVTWSGGTLDAHQYDEFEIRARMPDAEGETIYFPVIQTCEAGEYAWIEIPEEGGAEPESPAPAVTIVAATGDEHGAGAAGEEAEHDEESESSSDGPDALTWVALALGGLGAVLGGVALAASRRT